MQNIYIFILLDLQFYFILCLVTYKKSPFNWGIIRTKHTLLKFKVRLAILNSRFATNFEKVWVYIKHLWQRDHQLCCITIIYLFIFYFFFRWFTLLPRSIEGFGEEGERWWNFGEKSGGGPKGNTKPFEIVFYSIKIGWNVYLWNCGEIVAVLASVCELKQGETLLFHLFNVYVFFFFWYVKFGHIKWHVSHPIRHLIGASNRNTSIWLNFDTFIDDIIVYFVSFCRDIWQ